MTTVHGRTDVGRRRSLNEDAIFVSDHLLELANRAVLRKTSSADDYTDG